MKHNPSGPERKLWRLLQGLKAQGYYFRRQVAVGHYVVGFVCQHANLIVEIDDDRVGDATDRAYVVLRDEFLHDEGYDVMHLTGDDVVSNWDGVVMAIEQVLADRPKSDEQFATS